MKNALTRLSPATDLKPPPDADSVIAGPIAELARRLVEKPAPPELLLAFAEALEEAADYTVATYRNISPTTCGLRDLAAYVRSAVPVRDDSNPEMEETDDPA